MTAKDTVGAPTCFSDLGWKQMMIFFFFYEILYLTHDFVITVFDGCER
jgi:hypothetical protein